MNCFLGTSNGSVDNVIIDDENTSVIQISLCVNRSSYFDMQVVTNTRDMIQFNSQYYGFTRLFFPSGDLQKTDGWQSYEIVKHTNLVQFKFNFYDINTLGHWMGGARRLDPKSARRIFGRFFPSASLQDPTQDQNTGVWKTKSIQNCDLYANIAYNLKNITTLQSEMKEAKDQIGQSTLLLALLSEQMANIERSYILSRRVYALRGG